ncbi:MAG: hypothetical protein DRO11_04925 [Methanobacteriota archaeon]|nr:MAG: hypothetical protein DRO11_04925 [Euryarchaeota archaeon]
MSLKLKCSECDESYICFIDNTRVYGPIIETTCPNCGNFIQRNLSKYVETLTEEEFGQTRIIRAVVMQQLAREICKLVADDDPRKSKKRKKRKM